MMTRSGEILFLVAVLAALAGVLFALVPAGLSSNEEGVQYVQMKNIVLNGSFEIHAPALALGFEAEDIAGPRGFFESRGGRLYAIPPPLFPWTASLLYPVFGERAVDFTPILFVFLSALVLGLILDRVMQRDFLYWLLLATFLIGSPVLMQGFQFSGMALSLLLIVSALWLLEGHFGGDSSRAKLFLASVLVGLSAIVRIECLIVVFSYYLCSAIVLFAHRRLGDLWTVFAGGVFCLIVLILHDVVLHGRIPGPYLQLVLPFYALSPIRLAALGGGLALSCVLFILSRREESGPVRKAVLSVLSVILLFGAVLVTAARITVSHLMALFPAVLFLFYGIPERLERLTKGEGTLDAILTAAVVFCLAIGSAILRPGSWIVVTVWLPIVPFVILLIARERKTLFAARGMCLVLAFFCGVAFVNGIEESKKRVLQFREYNAARVAFLEKHTSSGDAVVFDDTGKMEHAGPLFFERVFLVARSPGDRDRLFRTLAAGKVENAYAWTGNPMGLVGFNPYSMEKPPEFPPPPGSKSCCGGSCKERNYYLVRLDTRAVLSTGTGRGGS
ncbi:MAG TPA: hypothetical protein PLQ15_04605 [Syntrophales bacterium]|nr:hypothetical protein [Syntrophales bacterium]